MFVIATFCKPIQDRRVSPAVVSKGSIYAAVQKDATRVVNGNSTASNDSVSQPSLQPTPHHDTVPINHRATPYSDTSDPDAALNTNFDSNIGVSSRSSISSNIAVAVGMEITQMIGDCQHSITIHVYTQMVVVVTVVVVAVVVAAAVAAFMPHLDFATNSRSETVVLM